MPIPILTAWTPRNLRKPATVASGLCERTLSVLRAIIISSLKPFPEALRALQEGLRRAETEARTSP